MHYSDDEVILTAGERQLLAQIERSLDAEELVSEPASVHDLVIGVDAGWRLDLLALLLAALGGVALGLLPMVTSSAAAVTATVMAGVGTITAAVFCGVAPMRAALARRRRRAAKAMRRRWRLFRAAVTLN